MNDTTNNLFEHIKNRLATGYSYGDDNQTIVDGIPNHRTSYESIREDHEGDVGIFEYLIDPHNKYGRTNSEKTLWKTSVLISVVCINGDVETCKDYLLDSFDNLVDDKMSSDIYMQNVKLVNMRPAGKNSKGLQMVIMNIQCSYYKKPKDLD